MYKNEILEFLKVKLIINVCVTFYKLQIYKYLFKCQSKLNKYNDVTHSDVTHNDVTHNDVTHSDAAGYVNTMGGMIMYT